MGLGHDIKKGVDKVRHKIHARRIEHDIKRGLHLDKDQRLGKALRSPVGFFKGLRSGNNSARAYASYDYSDAYANQYLYDWNRSISRLTGGV